MSREASAPPSGPSGGIMVISLDFELGWGLRGSRGDSDWPARIRGAREVVPRLLDLFVSRDVHATWGTVGALALQDWDELRANLPKVRSDFKGPDLCPYQYIRQVEGGDGEKQLHFAPDLVRSIVNAPGQELATHTFLHYHCTEPGHTTAAFEADLVASLHVLGRIGPRPQSIIFPKNQVAEDCLRVCADHGIVAYRGNAPGWLARPRSSRERARALRRVLRVLDEVLPLSGCNCHPPASVGNGVPWDVTASRLFRPGRVRGETFDRLLVRRITRSMSHAARRGLVYHLWWHPHNFALDTERKLRLLEEVIAALQRLREERGMMSMTMLEAARATAPAATGAGAE
ncbi:MAG: polysaccharide deacetylase family protein [Armatimonadota bacterium]